VTLTIDLPNDLERELAAEAAQLGLALGEYALRVLAGGRIVASAADGAPQTGAELVAFWEQAGVIGSRTDIHDPAAHARELRGQAENRARGDA
jgi:hypothetical protein